MNWKNFISIISRPPGVFHYSFLFHEDDFYKQFHRRVFFHRLPHVNKFKNIALIWLRLIAWYFYFGWFRVYKVYCGRKSYKTPLILGNKKQLYHLLKVTFIYIIPPFHYYRLSLYKYSESEWLTFLFEHEVPKWQDLVSNSPNRNEVRFLSSKDYFAQICNSSGIKALRTIQIWNKGDEVNCDIVFNQKNYFFKPDSGSGGIGCYLLKYFKEEASYELICQKSWMKFKTKNSILMIIRKNIGECRYLMQEEIVNSSHLNQIMLNEGLINLRIVSCKSKNCKNVKIISALIFIPENVESRTSRFIRIKLEDGSLSKNYLNETFREISNEQQYWLLKNKNFIIPYWNEIKLMCHKAHLNCINFYSIGWDVCITPDGPVLIEGNNGFSTINHQLDGDRSLMANIKEDYLYIYK